MSPTSTVPIDPAPPPPLVPSRLTLGIARLALVFTVIAWTAYLVEQALRVVRLGTSPHSVGETAIYLMLVTLLTLAGLAYLLARVGYIERIRQHRRVPRQMIDDFFYEKRPSLTVLVPSYREETTVVRLTLLSAALQEFARLRVVLLIDDPPQSSNPEHQKALARMRELPKALAAHLRRPHRDAVDALRAFERQSASSEPDTLALQRLADQYRRAARWFLRERGDLVRVDHVDDFYAEEFLGRMARELTATADTIQAAASDPDEGLTWHRVHQLYLRLVHLFDAEFTSFERKQYASLSHEPNKAMNLNSYIGLMGGAYDVVGAGHHQTLTPVESPDADLVVPHSDYILTLDADSLLLPEYCQRLVYHLEQEENASVAIAQTPYSAYRGSSSRLERIAGATTDIQHIAHVGMTHYGATSWVGANAVIRMRALESIEETEEHDGVVIRRYISDRTVIEDTESSIDLRERGWQLYNYPERLSYSATPPDFGALVIQRRRWANGGLVILPKLLRLAAGRQHGIGWFSSELFLRASYLSSIVGTSVGLLLLLFYPFDSDLFSYLAVTVAVPYWLMMASDLRHVGYRRRDVFLVYGFNLLLLPVSLAGTYRSLKQIGSKRRPAFARTPKVQSRTVAPLLFVTLPMLLILWSLWLLVQDVRIAAYVHGALVATNLATLSLACFVLVGVKALSGDVIVNVRTLTTRVPRRDATSQPTPLSKRVQG